MLASRTTSSARAFEAKSAAISRIERVICVIACHEKVPSATGRVSAKPPWCPSRPRRCRMRVRHALSPAFCLCLLACTQPAAEEPPPGAVRGELVAYTDTMDDGTGAEHYA